MKVKVTAEMITKGRRKCSKSCPLTLALIAAGLGDVGHVEVAPAWNNGWQAYYWKHGTGRVSVDLPTFVAAAVSQYDDMGKMSPFEFDLEV